MVDKIRVMIADDSSVVRGVLSRHINQDPGMVVIDVALNGKEAADKAGRQHPDILLLDIEMPVMDGLTALPKIVEASPATRIIMISTLIESSAKTALKALNQGAHDYIAKPTAMDSGIDAFLKELTIKIRALARKSTGGAAHSNVKTTELSQAINGSTASIVKNTQVADHAPMINLSSDFSLAPKRQIHTPKALAIGSSTGGPQALLILFGQLKGRLSHLPIFITQHMPPIFISILAQNITKASGMECREPSEGEVIQNGKIYIAPGEKHLLLSKNNDQVVAHLSDDPPENFCRPAVDPMLRSLSKVYGKNMLISILTGMGHDGMQGADIAYSNGATVIAQNEATSVVWGMPGAAARKGICSAVLPLEDMAPWIIKACGGA
jgi:two-component system chemotaxis response regulator CheB